MSEDGGRWPDFFIVGAPKCGTTSLYAVLKSHPAVFFPENKEPMFFNTDLSHPHAVRSENIYNELFSRARPDQVCGDASTLYLSSLVAPGAIRQRLPDAKIIILIRDPVEQMYSWYRHLKYWGYENAPSFSDAISLQRERREGHKLPIGNICHDWLQYEEMASFSRQIDRYRGTFPESQLGVWLLEDLKEVPNETLVDIASFLGLDSILVSEHCVPEKNTNKALRFPVLKRSLQVMRAYPGIRAFLKATMPVSVRKKLLLGINKIGTRKEKAPPISPELRLALRHRMMSEVRRLSEIVGQDLPVRWGWEGDTNR
ncbi:sulfotransferase [Salinisphaera sp. PC39]|uniref:sulfotransferase family protein n=1 Tax=Salinisphaera sp. PC39 TaxID=1304156 RepID=UPI0033426947